jgi:PST family polysaccharide transporter
VIFTPPGWSLRISAPHFGTVHSPAPSLRRNAALLLIGNAISLAAPLITVPYLARVLGPEGWAPVLLAQALAAWLVMVMEFGFELSGTRALARTRGDAVERAAVVQGVTSAKLLLAPVVTLVLILVFALTPGLRASSRGLTLIGQPLLGWTLLYVLLRGLNPFWFFQGLERVGAAVLVDSGARLAAAFGVFLAVHDPNDAPTVLALQAVAALVATLVLTRWMARDTAVAAPSVTKGLAMLREGLTLFTFRAASGGFAALNLFIVSLLGTPVLVAVFGGAERIIRAGISTLHPLTQALLPRVSFLRATDSDAADRLVQRSLLVTGGLGVVIGATAFLGAPLLVHLLLGPGYDGAVPLLRILALLPPLVAIDTVLGLHWAVPHGHDRPFLATMLVAGSLNVALAIALLPRFGASGVSAAVVLAECGGMLALVTLWRRHTR